MKLVATRAEPPGGGGNRAACTSVRAAASRSLVAGGAGDRERGQRARRADGEGDADDALRAAGAGGRRIEEAAADRGAHLADIGRKRGGARGALEERRARRCARGRAWASDAEQVSGAGGRPRARPQGFGASMRTGLEEAWAAGLDRLRRREAAAQARPAREAAEVSAAEGGCCLRRRCGAFERRRRLGGGSGGCWSRRRRSATGGVGSGAERRLLGDWRRRLAEPARGVLQAAGATEELRAPAGRFRRRRFRLDVDDHFPAAAPAASAPIEATLRARRRGARPQCDDGRAQPGWTEGRRFEGAPAQRRVGHGFGVESGELRRSGARSRQWRCGSRRSPQARPSPRRRRRRRPPCRRATGQRR